MKRLMEVPSLAGFLPFSGWPQKAQKTQKRFAFVLLFVRPMRIVFGLETLSARVPTAASISRRWVGPVA
jgi:hypothetical protein